MKSLVFSGVLLAILLIGIVLERKSRNFGGYGFVVSLISGGVLVVFLGLLVPLVHFENKVEIRGYYAFVETISNARLDEMNEIERANLTPKIAEWNEWIAKRQYENNTILDWTVPDEVMKLESIK